MIDCPALHERFHEKGYPFGERVPVSVVMKRTAMTDTTPGLGFINKPPIIAIGGITYPVWVNSYGAISVELPDGKRLGVRPGEFIVTEWHEIEGPSDE